MSEHVKLHDSTKMKLIMVPLFNRLDAIDRKITTLEEERNQVNIAIEMLKELRNDDSS